MSEVGSVGTISNPAGMTVPKTAGQPCLLPPPPLAPKLQAPGVFPSNQRYFLPRDLEAILVSQTLRGFHERQVQVDTGEEEA
jgi:hypothetical protein